MPQGDLLTLRRHAPTLTRAGLMIILQICASFAWAQTGGDVTGAFLQGDQSLPARKDLEPLYLKAPREELPNMHKDRLMNVVRGIFGLANSPRLWWRPLRDTLLRMGGWQLALDRAVFVFHAVISGVATLIAIIGVHVDDIIAAAMRIHGEKILATLRKTFGFGKWFDEGMQYCGKKTERTSEGCIRLTQKVFAENLQLAPMPRYRAATPEAALSATEMTEYQSGIGSLQWLVGQSRPDIAAATNLAQGSSPTVKNLVEINRILRETRKSADFALEFRPVDTPASSCSPTRHGRTRRTTSARPASWCS